MLACLAHGQDGKEQPKPVRRFQIELLYTMHTSVDADAKLERIRALVVKAYPDAKFAEVGVEDRKVYYGTYRDRLLRMAGETLESVRARATGDVKQYGYVIVKEQVAREVALRSIYQFLHSQAKDDVSLKVIFEKLKAKDDPKNPVCATEPGKGLLVYRDFGGKPLSGTELTDMEDGGVTFGKHFRFCVLSLGSHGLPKMSCRADGLGEEWDGRQIFRLVAVEK
jgi:hypothetical protein